MKNLPKQSLFETLFDDIDDLTPEQRELIDNADSKRTPKHTNRLFFELSPYLKQHAHNPVNWWPWSEESLTKAVTEDRLILLSVGYSTCHWCHVMEHESFEDNEVASILNSCYVPIKVDREERPDIDSVYMLATQAISGQGGWPMTVWLAPNLKPVFAGTYFPARDGERGAPYGFLTLLRKLEAAYRQDRENLLHAGEALSTRIQEHYSLSPSSDLPQKEAGISKQKAEFDLQNGGLTGAPKFPTSLPLKLMLSSSKEYFDQAVLTLSKVCSGGIRDQIGGGFHRYTVDGAWMVPHFEKMLYDNAMLLSALSTAQKLSPTPLFAEAFSETKEFLLSELRGENHLFYSAIDADSSDETGSSVEGYFYTWLKKELPKEVETYHFEGREIILSCPLQLKRNLKEARKVRSYPFLDKKQLCAWNALTVSALFEVEECAAEVSLAAMLEAFVREDDLVRVAGAKEPGHLDDFSYFIQALIDGYQRVFKQEYLQQALVLTSKAAELFRADSGAFYSSRVTPTSPPFREQSCFDNPLPSPNAVHAMNLLRLFALTGKPELKGAAVKIFEAFGTELQNYPQACGELCFSLGALQSDIARVKVSDLATAEAVRSLCYPYKVIILDPAVKFAEVCFETRCVLSAYNIEQVEHCLNSL